MRGVPAAPRPRPESVTDALHACSARSPREELHQLLMRCTRYGALHPLRGATPEQKGCNADGSGAVPTDRVQCPHNNHNCAQRLPTHPVRQSQTQPHSHTATQPRSHTATQPRDARPSSGLASQQKQSGRYTRYGALHHLGSLTSPPNWCNSALSGATPLGNKHNHDNVPSRKEPRRLPLGNRRGLALTTQLSRSR